MYRGFLVSLILFAPGQALAFTWTQGSVVLDSSDASYLVNGAGAPAVEFDPQHNEFKMFFEYKSANTHANCPGGIWGLGVARSSDGENWTVMDGDLNVLNGISPLAEPNPTGNTTHDCVIGHPAVVNRSGGLNTKFRVYYKAQDNSAGNYTGIGSMVVTFSSLTGLVAGAAHSLLLLPITDVFGFSNVIQREDGTFYMLVAKKITGQNKFGLWDATAPGEGGPWTLSASAAMLPTDFNYTWAVNELFSPDLFCYDVDPLDGVDELHAWVGGRTYGAGGTISSAGFGEAESLDDGASWSLQNPPDLTWSGGSAFRHFDMVQLDKSGAQHFMLYWSELDASNKPQIRFGYTDTTPGFNMSDVVDSRCP